MKSIVSWLAGVAVCLNITTSPVRAVPAQGDDERTIAFASTIAVDALTFRQGDRQALARVQPRFTDAGWQQFLSILQGWLDSSGTPTFGSAFVASGSGRIVDRADEVVHVRIPGSLTQTQGQARTTYQVAAADVWVAVDPLKVQRLTQTTCLGASSGCR